jgi:hypothetical protein
MPMWRQKIVVIVLGLHGVLFVTGCGRSGTPASQNSAVSFSKDVAPILYKHCVSCHHPGGIGPMPLLTYQQVQPYSSLIRDRVVNGIMPPWFADAPRGQFSNDPRLSKTQIQTITTWVDRGSPERDPTKPPTQPKWSEGWVNGRPDAVFSMPEAYTVPAHGEGRYVYFKIPTHFKEDKWVETIQVLPGNPRIVHHASLEFQAPAHDPTDISNGRISRRYIYKVGMLHFIRLDAPVLNDGCSSQWGGQFPGVRTIDEDRSGGDIAVYLPGRPAEYHPPGYAVRIPAGSVLTLQMHYMPMGMAEQDRTRIGFWFAKGPVKAVKRVEIWNMLFKIPAEDPNVRVTSCYTFPETVHIISYTMHMHYRGKDATIYAVYPDGKQETLLSIPHYTFNWQLEYILAHPKTIPKGTVIRTIAHFDNSRDNPLDPNPTKTIRWGEPSDTEMMGTWIEFTNDKGASLSATRPLIGLSSGKGTPKTKTRQRQEKTPTKPA